MNNIFSSLITFLLLFTACQQNALLTPSNAKQSIETETLAYATLPENFNPSAFKLIHQNNPTVTVPHQISGNKMYWKVTPKNLTGAFELFPISSQTPQDNTLESKEKNGQWTIAIENQKVLGYQMAVTEAPKGENPAYRRSGYIHPLNTPSGKRLTRIQPKDHFHHYGLWNPWTHTLYEGDTLDFWNLAKEQGTVRFSKMLSHQTGPVFSAFEVLHEHVVLKNDKNKVVLNEIQKVRVTPLTETSYQLDFEISYQCNTSSPFKIIKYRYGGFGWRTTEEWDNQNSRTLSSKGKTRKNADGSTARWCIVDGKLGDGHGGAVMLSHPDNFNHPEPLRIWPEDQYERGDLFVNFATTKNTDWLFEPNQKYILRYRLIVYDNKIDSEIANIEWEKFKSPLVYNFN